MDNSNNDTINNKTIIITSKGDDTATTDNTDVNASEPHKNTENSYYRRRNKPKAGLLPDNVRLTGLMSCTKLFTMMMLIMTAIVMVTKTHM